VADSDAAILRRIITCKYSFEDEAWEGVSQARSRSAATARQASTAAAARAGAVPLRATSAAAALRGPLLLRRSALIPR